MTGRRGLTVHEAIAAVERVVELAQRLERTAEANVGPVGNLMAVDLRLDAEVLLRKLKAVVAVIGEGAA